MSDKKNVYFFQPQYTNFINGHHQCWLPYTAGVVWSYALQQDWVKDNFNLGGFYFQRDPLEKVLSELQEPKVCAFCAYIWNQNYCLALAEKIKSIWPDCLIVMGGPQASGSWISHDFIDSIVLGEGEIAFVEILERCLKALAPEKFYKKPRLLDLSNLPSPYSLGLFDDIVAQNPGVYWSTSLETNRGCPFSCTFCDWGGLIQSKILKFNLDRIADDLDWITQNRVKTIFVTDANFGIFKDRDLEIAKIIRRATEKPGTDLEYVSVTYAKNTTEHVFAIAQALGRSHKGITFSVQSMNHETLDVIKRKNLEINQIKNLLELSQKYKVHHYTELILGLPLETKETWKSGICEVLETGQHHRIEIHPANVLEHTEMYRDQREKYKMKIVNAVNILPYNAPDHSGILEHFPTIAATNTMSTDDMIESWMYSWMIVHLHINQYTQIMAKYSRHVLGIKYRQFYDRVFICLQDPNFGLKDEFDQRKEMITNLYTTGNINQPEVHDILWHSNLYFFEHYREAINLGIAVAKSFGEVAPGIIDIQRRVIRNNVWTTPFTADTDYDIETWKPGPWSYDLIDSQLGIDGDADTLYIAQRRLKVMNNLMIKNERTPGP